MMPVLTWFEPKMPPRSLTVIVHGLNLNPARMDSIAKTLCEAGSLVARVALTGHRGDDSAFKNVTREIWIQDVHEALLAAKTRLKNHKIPLHFVGFSLGAVLLLEHTQTFRDSELIPEKQILISPSLGLKPFLTLMVELQKFLPSSFGTVGYGFKTFRAVNFLPLQGYRALFDVMDSVIGAPLPHLEVPTLVILHPKDDVLSFKAISSLLKKNQAEKWEMWIPDNSECKMRFKYNHMVIDEETLGRKGWREMKRAMLAHFELSF